MDEVSLACFIMVQHILNLLGEKWLITENTNALSVDISMMKQWATRIPALSQGRCGKISQTIGVALNAVWKKAILN